MREREERISGEDERIVRESIKVEKERELLLRDGNNFRRERGEEEDRGREREK